MWIRLCSCAGSRVGAWLLACPTTPTFPLSSAHFLTTLRTHLGLPHLTVAHLSQCWCDHTINNLGTHLLRCPCENEHTVAHDTLWNIIVTIVLENEAHVKWRSPTFSLATPNNEWISLTLEMIFELWWMLSLLTQLAQRWCNEHWWQQHMQRQWLLKKNMILCQTSIRRWFHSLCYRNVWVFSFSFQFNYWPFVHKPLLHIINGL
jgi:hypothetical protein